MLKLRKKFSKQAGLLLEKYYRIQLAIISYFSTTWIIVIPVHLCYSYQMKDMSVYCIVTWVLKNFILSQTKF